MSSNSLDDWAEQATNSAGIERLPAHLAARYDIAVGGRTELDVGTFSGGQIRPFAVGRQDLPVGTTAHLGAGRCRYPDVLVAGRFSGRTLPHSEPVSHWAARGLVTEFVSGIRPDKPGRTFAILSGLHARSDTSARAAGGWHHLALQGGPQDEIDIAGTILGPPRRG